MATTGSLTLLDDERVILDAIRRCRGRVVVHSVNEAVIGRLKEKGLVVVGPHMDHTVAVFTPAGMRALYVQSRVDEAVKAYVSMTCPPCVRSTSPS